MPTGVYPHKSRPLAAIFAANVADGPAPEYAPDLGPCLLWQGWLDPDGYGQMKSGGSHLRAHRVAIILADGPIPDGMQVDHLCRVRACVRRSHLEVVTPRENVLRGFGPAAKHARQTHCVHGHMLTEKNVYLEPRPNGRVSRKCRECCLKYSARQKHTEGTR